MAYIREYSELAPQEKRQLFYKRQYKQEHPEWDDSMILLRDLVDKRLVEKPVVLDFGCGRGNFVIDELRKKFSRAVGFDVAHESVEGNVTNDEVVIGEENTLPFSDETFDAAISLWVFEHLEHPEETLKEIARVLKPGGFLAFVTPNKKSLLIALRRCMTDGIAHRLLKRFYGREEHDAFSVYYQANTVRDIKKLASLAGLSTEVLTENADPSYTSFNGPTFWLSKLFTRWFGALARPHVIAILRKP